MFQNINKKKAPFLKNIYTSSEFKDAQKDFEKRLGIYAYKHQLAYNAVDEGLQKMKEVIYKYYEKTLKSEKDLFLKTFVNSNVLNNNEDKDKLYQYMKSIVDSHIPDQISNDKIAKATGLDAPVNLQEKMTAFYNAAYFNDMDPNNNTFKGKNDKTGFTFRSIMQDIMSNNSDKAGQLVNTLNLSSSIINEKNKVDNPGFFKKLFGLNKNTDVYSDNYIIKNSKDKKDKSFFNIFKGNSLSEKRGFAMTSGISSTTAKLLNTYKWLGFNDDKLLNFRLALIGFLITKGNNSLYEILKASHMVGVCGQEDLTDAISMDSSEISPLSKDEILNHCGKIPPQNTYPRNLLPFDEYMCSRFIHENEDERNQDDDNSKKSIFSLDAPSVFPGGNNNDFNYLESIATSNYSMDSHLVMNRKLSLGSFLFNMNLKYNMTKYFYEYISDFCTEDQDDLNTNPITQLLKQKICAI